MNDTRTDRGQLILAGAVSFALILIAIAVVFSTTLFTASVGSSGTVETVSDGTGTAQSVEHTTRGLLERVNQQNDWLLTQNRTFVDRSEAGSKTQLETNLRRNVSDYDRLFAESKSESGPTYLNTTPSSLSYGTRVKATGLTSLPAETLTTGKNLDEFVMLINTSTSTTTSEMIVRAEGTNGNEAYVAIEKSSGQVHIDSGPSTSGLLDSPECTVSPVNETVYVDLTGEFAAGDPFIASNHQHCPQRFTDELTAPYTVEVTQVGTLNYEYEYTVGSEGYSPPGSISATTYDVIWSTEISLIYESSTVLRESTTEVSSYEP